MAYVRPGGRVIVTELSRMSRSLMHVLEVVKTFKQQGTELVSVRENIDTSTATGHGLSPTNLKRPASSISTQTRQPQKHVDQ